MQLSLYGRPLVAQHYQPFLDRKDVENVSSKKGDFSLIVAFGNSEHLYVTVHTGPERLAGWRYKVEVAIQAAGGPPSLPAGPWVI